MNDFNRNRLIDWALKLYVLLAFSFIFAPIAASFVFSFNADRFPSLRSAASRLSGTRRSKPTHWSGKGCANTLAAGIVVSVVATAIGFGAAYTDFRYKFFGKTFYVALALLPPTIPVVILGLAMLAFLSNINLSGAIHSVIIAHVVMCAPFAMAIVRLRLSQMDPSLEAAAWKGALGMDGDAPRHHPIL